MNITEFDVVFLSYDEPNAERNFAHLVEICPWAKRVHGVKGFDTAHRTCAEIAETEWFITVDADNIVHPQFFDQTIDIDDRYNCISWNGRNVMNNLRYGNGGLKLWKKSFVLSMNTHENSDDPRKAVDFCWEDGYIHKPETFSDVFITASRYQAFRVGFREGVKLTLDRGQRISPEMMKHKFHPMNLRNLRIWACVGTHVDNGLWAIYGCRLAWLMMCDLQWDHTVVRDFDWIWNFWNSLEPFGLNKVSFDLGQSITEKTKIQLPLLSPSESAFFSETFY